MGGWNLASPESRVNLAAVMTELKWVTPQFAVAPQITAGDVAIAAAQGIKTIINNRPDGEVPGQPKGEELRQAAAAQSLAYYALPFAGPPPPATVADMAVLLDRSTAPVLACCRTGTRSITAWGMAQALSGARRPDEIIALARKAGYDLSGAREALETLAPRR